MFYFSKIEELMDVKMVKESGFYLALSTHPLSYWEGTGIPYSTKQIIVFLISLQIIVFVSNLQFLFLVQVTKKWNF